MGGGGIAFVSPSDFDEVSIHFIECFCNIRSCMLRCSGMVFKCIYVKYYTINNHHEKILEIRKEKTYKIRRLENSCQVVTLY